MSRNNQLGIVLAGMVTIALLIACSATLTGAGQTPPTATPENRVTVSYWTNDTKAEWVHAVTEPFNQRRIKTSTGREVYVEVVQLSSGDVFQKIRSGEIQPTVWSPGDMS